MSFDKDWEKYEAIVDKLNGSTELKEYFRDMDYELTRVRNLLTDYRSVLRDVID